MCVCVMGYVRKGNEILWGKKERGRRLAVESLGEIIRGLPPALLLDLSRARCTRERGEGVVNGLHRWLVNEICCRSWSLCVEWKNFCGLRL